MVRRHQLAVVAALEERELRDPAELPLVRRDDAQLVRDVQAERAEHGVDQLARAELQEEDDRLPAGRPPRSDPVRMASLMVFMGERVHAPPAPMRARARPRAPRPLTNSSSLSISAFDILDASAAAGASP